MPINPGITAASIEPNAPSDAGSFGQHEAATATTTRIISTDVSDRSGARSIGQADDVIVCGHHGGPQTVLEWPLKGGDLTRR